MCKVGGDCLFLGSRLANSLLLKYTRLAWDRDGMCVHVYSEVIFTDLASYIPSLLALSYLLWFMGLIS